MKAKCILTDDSTCTSFVRSLARNKSRRELLKNRKLLYASCGSCWLLQIRSFFIILLPQNRTLDLEFCHFGLKSLAQSMVEYFVLVFDELRLSVRNIAWKSFAMVWSVYPVYIVREFLDFFQLHS